MSSSYAFNEYLTVISNDSEKSPQVGRRLVKGSKFFSSLKYMVASEGKIKTQAFVNYIEELAKGSCVIINENNNEKKKALIEKFISDTNDLINNDEWGIGLENLLSNLYEIDFKLNNNAIELAKLAINANEMNLEQLSFIEELKK